MDANINALIAKIQKLEEENVALKYLLHKYGIPFQSINNQNRIITTSKTIENAPATKRLSLQEKVELFQGLFRGREDVFAKRWYSNTTKLSGYQPVCEHEWNRVFCFHFRFSWL